jgi:hypothetical protein
MHDLRLFEMVFYKIMAALQEKSVLYGIKMSLARMILAGF